MPATEKLIEFDAREMWLKYPEDWPAERRRQYLLREDVDKPLSTDSMVWASLRDMHATESDRLEALAVLEGRDPAEELPHWNWYVSQDLRVVRRYAHRMAAGRPYWIIAVSVLTSSPLTGEPVSPGTMTSYLEVANPQPDQRDGAWLFLGFDVSDEVMLSGLSNCGYTDNEAQAARQDWARHLNQHHLFEDPAIAWRFKEFTDRRVPEHQPFHVFGLWLVERAPAGPEGA